VTGSRTAASATPERDLDLVPGRYGVVANEEAEAAVAEVVRLDDNGVVLVRVREGSVEDNRPVLETLPNPH
jgi:hypothetical protein